MANRLRIGFRTDASIQIGTGHVMRCLTLADALRERGAECLFICRPHHGNLLDSITQRGHTTVVLPALMPSNTARKIGEPAHACWLGVDWAADAEQTHYALQRAVDWLVVDHYALDRRWEQALRPDCRLLMVMDDLADRPHDCDLLLDTSLGRNVADYASLVPPKARTLLGPRFALLRPEFARLRAESLTRRQVPRLRQLLVTMGGVDKDNATGHVLDALNSCDLPPDLRIVVVMGPHAPWLDQVLVHATGIRRPTQVLVGVNNMARLMVESDLAIGAAGGTSWERCCMGLPSFVLVLADNQHAVAAALQSSGAAVAVQKASQIATYLQERLLSGTVGQFLLDLGNASSKITDGEGVSRIADRMVGGYV